MREDGREGEGGLGEAQGASGPKRNSRGRLSCREGWEAEQVSVAEVARERGDASSERQRTWRSLERGPGRRAWCGGCERTGKGSSRTEGADVQ